MDPRERIEAFWSGERPDEIPYTIYSYLRRQVKDDPAWLPLFAAGLRVTYGVGTVAERMKDVEVSRTTERRGGHDIVHEVMRTPVGDLHREIQDGWVQTHWLKTADDYRIMRHVVLNTELAACYEDYAAAQKQVADHGIVHVYIGARSPMQKILVDFVGLENFAFHLCDLADEMQSLYDALLRDFRKRVEMIAAGPGRFVSLLENFTAETMGPARFARFHVPVYRECFPVLQSAGKIVGAHYDGKLACCKDLIAASPIDLIESLTPPPEGDMTLAEARAAWPTKLFWSNINVSGYSLDPAALRRLVFDTVAQAAPDGRLLALEVSEDLPANWRESIPVVQAALREVAGG